MTSTAPPRTPLALAPRVADRPTRPEHPAMTDTAAALARIETVLLALDDRLGDIETALTRALGATHPAARAIARRELAAPRPVAAPVEVPTYMSTAEAAEVLGTSIDTVRAMIRRGDLDALPLGRNGRVIAWRIPETALRALPPVVTP